ncbi:hypothetical protein DMUE_4311 [Dictyocoela muelleri]|nr:hypothetical protein DMUE_4311 [Dictyocoela muelleri]
MFLLFSYVFCHIHKNFENEYDFCETSKIVRYKPILSTLKLKKSKIYTMFDNIQTIPKLFEINDIIEKDSHEDIKYMCDIINSLDKGKIDYNVLFYCMKIFKLFIVHPSKKFAIIEILKDQNPYSHLNASKEDTIYLWENEILRVEKIRKMFSDFLKIFKATLKERKNYFINCCDLKRIKCGNLDKQIYFNVNVYITVLIGTISHLQNLISQQNDAILIPCPEMKNKRIFFLSNKISNEDICNKDENIQNDSNSDFFNYNESVSSSNELLLSYDPQLNLSYEEINENIILKTSKPNSFVNGNN